MNQNHLFDYKNKYHIMNKGHIKSSTLGASDKINQPVIRMDLNCQDSSLFNKSYKQFTSKFQSKNQIN